MNIFSSSTTRIRSPSSEGSKNRCLTFVSPAESYLLSPSLETVSSGMLDAIMMSLETGSGKMSE